MRGKIRKLKLSYPFKVGESQKIDVYSVDDTNEKFAGNRINSIIERVDEITNVYVYDIYVYKGEEVQLWKEVYPSTGCTKEIEYSLS